MSKQRIVILATGGTIAGKGEQGKTGGYKPGEVDIATIIHSVPNIDTLADITAEQVLNTASDNITCADWLNLSKRISQLVQRDDVDGIVLTHGTDTLEETAYFLHLTVNTTKPIVCVGSMRPSTATSADGPFNLFQAVALAASPLASGKGVLIAFADGIYSARDVQKISTFRTEGFSARDLGCLGYMRDQQPCFYQAPLRKHTHTSEFDISKIDQLPKVEIAYFYIDADPALLQMLLDSCDGVVIAGAGNGGYSTKWKDNLNNSNIRNIPIVTSSRVSNGIVTLHPTSPKQCIPSDTLNPQKARVLLQLALTKASSIDQIKEIFQQY